MNQNLPEFQASFVAIAAIFNVVFYFYFSIHTIFVWWKPYKKHHHLVCLFYSDNDDDNDDNDDDDDDDDDDNDDTNTDNGGANYMICHKILTRHDIHNLS